MTGRILLVSFLFPLVAATAAASTAVPSSHLTASLPNSTKPVAVSGDIRFTYEELDMPEPAENHLGLLGFSFLGDLDYGFYAGLAGYGAVHGERGGFFTGGLAGGKTFHLLSRLYADTGLFVGGGGGGAAPQGGGLMIRGHAGLLLDLDDFRIGASLSRVEFPNGDIESGQLSLNVDVPFSFLAGRKSRNAGEERSYGFKETFGVGRQEIFVKAQNYVPESDSRKTSGVRLDENIQLLGFEFRSYLLPEVFWLLESSGALGGDADGYAEVLFGLGLSRRVGAHPAFGVQATLSAGGAGGGRVETGGGAVVKARLGFNMTFADRYILAVDGTYLDAFEDGHFSAYAGGIRLGWRMHVPVKGGPFSLKRVWDSDRWEIAAEHQSYLDPERKAALDDNREVHLISIQFRRYLSESPFYLSGQAAGAYEGGAGGYASGLVGPGYRWTPVSDSALSLRTEMLVGAGGGGGLDVGSGVLMQPNVTVSYRLTPTSSAGLSVGYVMAPDGELNSYLVGFNLSTSFILPNNRSSH